MTNVSQMYRTQPWGNLQTPWNFPYRFNLQRLTPKKGTNVNIPVDKGPGLLQRIRILIKGIKPPKVAADTKKIIPPDTMAKHMDPPKPVSVLALVKEPPEFILVLIAKAKEAAKKLSLLWALLASAVELSNEKKEKKQARLEGKNGHSTVRMGTNVAGAGLGAAAGILLGRRVTSSLIPSIVSGVIGGLLGAKSGDKVGAGTEKIAGYDANAPFVPQKS